MALSRFWAILFISSILFLLTGFLTGKFYTLDHILNGKKDDKMLVSQKKFEEINPIIRDSFKRINIDNTTIEYLENNETISYKKSGEIVKIYKGKQSADGLLPTCKNSIFDLILPLMAYLAFFCGLLQLLIDSGAMEKLALKLSPFFQKIFPDVPKNHPSFSYMTLNFAANFLGLDSAATPFGLKAMESLQTINPDKEKASNSQIMFMCLHAAGLTLIPTSIIGYRTAAGAQNPADVMLPCIITSFIGTLAALLIVGIKQKINFKNKLLILAISLSSAALIGFLLYINSLEWMQKEYLTMNFSSILLLIIIGFIITYAFIKEKHLSEKGTNIFSSFVEGANYGIKTGVTIFPYVLGMLAVISIFRNSGLFELVTNGITFMFSKIGVSKEITDSLPVALLRPFSSGGSRGFMIDAMNQFGPDSLAGRLSSIFQCSAETTFYVIAMYFGSIKVRNTRYTLGVMLLVDLICVLTAIAVAYMFFWKLKFGFN